MKRNKKDLLSQVEKDVFKSRFVANNTLRIEYTDKSVAIRLHDTDILTFKDNQIIVNSGGWRTVTTKARINEFSNLNLYQDHSQWFINGFPYYDGIIFDNDGNLVSKEAEDRSVDIAKMKKRISRYIANINKDNLPKPNIGDCWFCLMQTENGQNMGDRLKDTGHLLEHLNENYLHGSILVNSMREYGFQDHQIGLHYKLKVVDTFKRALRKYLQKRLIQNIAV